MAEGFAPRRLVGRLLGGRLTRSTILVASGTALAQGLGLLALPALTRLYSPETFGYFAIYASLLGVLVPVAAWRYPMAIILPTSHKDSWGIVVLSSLAIIATVTVVGAVVGGLWFVGAARLGWDPSTLVALTALPVGVFLMAHYEVAVQWAVRFQTYRALALGKISQGVAQIAAQLGAGFAGFGLLGLTGGDAIGRAAGATGVWRATKHVRHGLQASDLAGIRQQAIRYRAFPLISSWSALLNAAGGHLPPLLATLAFGPAIGGMFLVASRIVAVPTALIGSASAEVVAGEAAKRLRDGAGNVHSLFRTTLLVATAAGIVVMVAAALLLTPALPAILGPQWATGRYIFLVLTPLAAAQLAVGPISRGLGLFERQGLQLGWDALRLVATVTPFVLATMGILGTMEAIAAYALSGGALYFLHAWMILAVSRRSSNNDAKRAEP